MDKIVLKNGSIFEIIPSEESFRSVRRRLIDKESKYIQELEITKAKMRLVEFIKRLEL